MATGDQADILSRLRLLLPPWFPPLGQAPVIDGALTGIAYLLAGSYGLIAFARAQIRIATSTGAWLDLTAWDYFGGRFTRRPGETDATFSARIREEIIRPRVTRSAIRAALIEITGFPVRIIEPSRLVDVGFYKVRGSGIAPLSFWNVDAPGNPLRWSGRGLRCLFFVECVLPLAKAFGNNAMPAWGLRGGAGGSIWSLNWMLRGTAGARAWGSSLIKRGDSTVQTGSDLVYSLINSLRAAGVTAWVKFVPPSTQPYWDQPGAKWDSGATYDLPGQGPNWP